MTWELESPGKDTPGLSEHVHHEHSRGRGLDAAGVGSQPCSGQLVERLGSHGLW